MAAAAILDFEKFEFSINFMKYFTILQIPTKFGYAVRNDSDFAITLFCLKNPSWKPFGAVFGGQQPLNVIMCKYNP